MSKSAAKRKPKVERTRTLLFIALCFAGSVAARMGDIGAAVAQSAVDTAGAPFEPTVLPEQSATASVEPTPTAPSQREIGEAELACSCEGEPQVLLSAIRERDIALAAREAQMADREGMLRMAEERVKAEIARLEEAEAALARTLSVAATAAESDVAHIVGVYASMKPKDAAEVFGEMEPSLAAGFLSRMGQENAGSIIAAMEPNMAYAITAIMAGRNVGAGVTPAP